MEKKNAPILITLATFNNSSEAHLTKSKLEAHGIRCYLENESINTLYANALGGVNLKISSSDLDNALEILSHISQNKKNQILKLQSLFVCPSCGQLNENNASLNRKKTLWERFLISIFLHTPKVKCDYCKADFSKNELVK